MNHLDSYLLSKSEALQVFYNATGPCYFQCQFGKRCNAPSATSSENADAAEALSFFPRALAALARSVSGAVEPRQAPSQCHVSTTVDYFNAFLAKATKNAAKPNCAQGGTHYTLALPSKEFQFDACFAASGDVVALNATQGVGTKYQISQVWRFASYAKTAPAPSTFEFPKNCNCGK